jgi:hypothetical protein
LAGALSLAVDPHDPDRLYMAAGEYTRADARGGALLRSTDRGTTWAKTELPVKIGGNEDGRNTGERLMVDPHQGAVLFLGAKDGLYRSPDHGVTWSKVAAFPNVHVTLVAFDPAKTTTSGQTAIVYAGFSSPTGGGLLVSADGGVSWNPVKGQPKALVPHHLSIDAKGDIYVAYGNGLGPNGVTDGADRHHPGQAGRQGRVRLRRSDPGPGPSRRDHGLDPGPLDRRRRGLPQPR